MKTKRFSKVLITVFSAILLICALVGFGAAAAETDEVYSIKSINVLHGDTTTVLIAVDLPADEALITAPDAEVKYTLGENTLTADFHSYQYIEKYGKYYPVYYTVGIPAKDMGEAVVAEAHKAGATPASPAYANVSVVEYLYTRLYKNGIIEAAEGEDADRKEMYLALLNYGAWAQKVLWNNKAENKDNQRTLVTDYIYVTAKGATVNGEEGILLDKSAAVSLSAPLVAEYKIAGWQATSYDKAGKAIETKLLDTATYTPTASTLISPAYARAWEDYEDGTTSNSIDNTGGGGTASIVTEDGNSFYRVAKPEDKSAQEYIYTPNAGLTYTDSDCVVYEAKLRVDFDTSNQGSFFILYGRYNGFKKFSIQNEAAGSEELTISDWRDGASTTLSGKIGVKVGEWFTFRVENYKDAANNTIARVYINGVYFGESTNAGTNMNGDNANCNYNNITICSNNNMLNCKLDIDDVYVGEGKMYGFDDVVIDFEKSAVATTGGKVSNSNATVTHNNADSSVQIAEEGDNKYLSYYIGGWNDRIAFVPTVPAAEGATKFVFEADVKAEKIMIFNLFGHANGADSHKLYFHNDTADGTWGFNVGSTWLKTSLMRSEWVKIRIECEGTTVRVYGNGNLIAEATQNSFTTISAVHFYTYGGAKGDTVCFDNVKCGFVK